MKTIAWMLGLVVALAPLSAVCAAGEQAQANSDCQNQEQQKGNGEKTSKVLCAIKSVFQNRIRRRKATEPVEMTVGSPPMQTDDTETPGPGNWEVNVILNGDFAGSERRIDIPRIDINYGYGDRLQFKYEVPYVFVRSSEPAPGGGTISSNADGVGDSIFGVKYRFYDDNDTGLSFAVYPQIQFKTPEGPRSVSDGRTVLILPVMMTREFRASSISANIGVEASSGEHRYFASFGVGKRLNDHVALLAEIAGSDLNVTQRQVLLNVGLRWKISDTQSISGALGRDVYAGGDQLPDTHVVLAYQILVGK